VAIEMGQLKMPETSKFGPNNKELFVSLAEKLPITAQRETVK
jgi:hypothetical protein